jgi:hypothetical protein
MNPDITLYKEDLYRVITEKIDDADRKRIDEIFDDLEAEIYFLEERRKEAEENLNIFIKVLAEQQKENA